MEDLCWICRRQSEGRENDLVAPLLAGLKSRDKLSSAGGCRCEELTTESSAIRAHFYRLACGHYCAEHVDHRCCLCGAKAKR